MMSSLSVYLSFFLAIQIWIPSLNVDNALAKKPQVAESLPTLEVKSHTPTSPACLVATHRALTYDCDFDLGTGDKHK